MNISDYLPQTPRSRMTIAALGVVAVIGTIVVIRSSSSEPEIAHDVPVAMTVTAQTLHSSEIARAVTANGTVHPWQEIIIGPEVGGYRVEQVLVDVGDRVRRGQELVRLSGDMPASDVASKKANVLQAQATLENATSAFKRAQSLSSSGALSASDLDKLRSEELAASARVEVAKAELDGAELKLRYTHVTAPDDGIISARAVSIGQIAQTGSEMLHMIRKGRVEWRAEIPEARMREIEVGQAVRLTTADGTQLDGKVRTVAPTVESATRSGLVYVDIASTAAKPGMFARGEIVLDHGAAQMAPLASVVIQDGYSYVFVLTAQNTVQRRHIETGVVKGGAIEIVSGVQPGERIVDKGAGFLKDGDRVSVTVAEAAVAEAS
jgi:RND family efflux transporter MFP subunit